VVADGTQRQAHQAQDGTAPEALASADRGRELDLAALNDDNRIAPVRLRRTGSQPRREVVLDESNELDTLLDSQNIDSKEAVLGFAWPTEVAGRDAERVRKASVPPRPLQPNLGGSTLAIENACGLDLV
jgi:hypothetical protein